MDRYLLSTQKMHAEFLGDRGFSIGISDVEPSRLVSQKKQQIVDHGYKQCDELIAKFKAGKLLPQAGMDAEHTLEVTEFCMPL